ncbi:MAG: DUF4352 domain-containing protein [Ignavibacteriae bacterium]|nr:DUF4352 domain-containing protein [Ignavibacteriota bacterium]
MKNILTSIVVSFIFIIFTNQVNAQYKLGDEFQLGYFKYRVDNIEYKKEVSNGLNSFKSNGTLLIVHLTITNLDREPSTLTNSMFKVYDSDNYEFDTSQDAMIVMILKDQDKIFMLKEFQPKIPKKIIMPFEIPTSNDVYTLEVSGGFGTGQKRLIRLVK